MATVESGHTTPAGVTDRVRTRTFLHRRGRLLRGIALFVPVTAVIVYLSMLQRDTQAMKVGETNARMIADAMQTQLTAEHVPPQRMPDLPAPYQGVVERYYFNYFYGNKLQTSQVVGVCAMRQSTRLFLREDGRFVVLFDGSKFWSEWMTEAQFAQRAKALGISIELGP